MKKVIVLLLSLLTFFVLSFGNLHWSKEVDRVTAKAAKESQKMKMREKSEQAIILPKNIYVLKGSDESPIVTNLVFRNIINEDYNAISFKSNLGKQLKDRWEITTNKKTTITSAPLEIVINPKNSSEKRELTTNIKVINKENTKNIKLLSIGDSMTRPNVYGKQVQELLPNVSTLGTRTFDDGKTNGEGRGGWTINYYVNRIGDKTGVDSPFLFPISVPGTQYLGNTAFWKNVCYKDIDGYDYDGFQKIANGWTNAQCEFDKKGYPINPSEEDVIVDPTKPENERFLQFSEGEWVGMKPQPDVEVNFSKYMERYNVAFDDKKPNVINLLLGANDFYATKGIQGVQRFMSNLDTIIESIHKYDSDIKFIVTLPVVGNTQEAWDEAGLTQEAEIYKSNMQMLSRELIDRYDERENENIYVSSTNGVVGLEDMADGIHPNEEGYKKIGVSLAALIQKIRNEDM